MEMQPVGQRIDVDPALQMVDCFVQTTGLVCFYPGVEGGLRLARNVRCFGRGSLAQASVHRRHDLGDPEGLLDEVIYAAAGL